ncbi:MAG: thio(seleno)oxazole modification radical SAM maturase SbtM [Pseudomonadota bacterium]
MDDNYLTIYPTCRRILGDEIWDRTLAALGDGDPGSFSERLRRVEPTRSFPGYMADLALLEWTVKTLLSRAVDFSIKPDTTAVNPALVLLPLAWKQLPLLLESPDAGQAPAPEPGQTHVLAWVHPKTGRPMFREALDDDLLALKLVVEGIDFKSAAVAGNTSVARIRSILVQGVENGILVAPESGIRRDLSFMPVIPDLEPFLAAPVFTLQWHITQACDLHCRHCYDRSDRSPLELENARRILDDFVDFTSLMHVQGQVTFTGGNPLLYPHFKDLYREASERGFNLAILGHPSHAGQIDPILEIQEPGFYQISLEGLELYNDYIRGEGHFQRSLAFLDLLRARGVYAMVMLTLNRDNMDQVLPLAEVLRTRADAFTFNRLAMVGEGANLCLPDPADFKRFLQSYASAAASNPILTLKDNLINILFKEAGREVFGGCTGYGCGAAFNFVSLLPDGEVHACRKFPSSIGNINNNTLAEIFNSPRARQYREGSRACSGCSLSAVCRGCFAVAYGMGLDVFADRDPFCFYSRHS